MTDSATDTVPSLPVNPAQRRVRFVRMFFGPDGSRYRKDTWYNVPGNWALPMKKDKDRKIVPDYEEDLNPPAEAAPSKRLTAAERLAAKKVPVSGSVAT